jgi:triacylglycerol esterase/lipase EstA (alpha/beta hydrolase family)
VEEAEMAWRQRSKTDFVAALGESNLELSERSQCQNSMIASQFKIRTWFSLVAVGTWLAFLTGCATPQPAGSPRDVAAAKSLGEARSTRLSLETRAADYLHAAALTAPELGSGTQATLARETYNAAAGELTILLRSGEAGRLWNHPVTLTGNTAYHLRLAPGSYGIWAPDYFTSFESAAEIEGKLIKKGTKNTQEGVGGALVGVRVLNPRENFAPPRGITAPVTATLDFKGNDATLSLRRPAKETAAKVEGVVRPLAADFSAPVSYYQPPANLTIVGLMAGLRSGNYAEKTGLYFLQPYDPDRIPVIFVHGLFSTPFTWMQTINGLQADPELRKHYQFWVFAYPTGNPILYSALRLREELAKVDKLYPNHRPYVLVGHSMGGILSHAQVVTVTPAMWEKQLGDRARDFFARNASDSLVVRIAIFKANPRIKRVIFVCAPHRGSMMASSGVGKFGISLIALPLYMTQTLKDSLTRAELVQLTGSAKRLPNSVSGLKPSNPALAVIDSAKMTVPYHSIIGDRGKGDSPNSTDGVVPYWSSHLGGAQSECIVPGPHGSCNLPQTIDELKRILRLHLKTSGSRSPGNLASTD